MISKIEIKRLATIEWYNLISEDEKSLEINKYGDIYIEKFNSWCKGFEIGYKINNKQEKVNFITEDEVIIDNLIGEDRNCYFVSNGERKIEKYCYDNWAGNSNNGKYFYYKQNAINWLNENK